jgi:hypothetical protein
VVEALEESGTPDERGEISLTVHTVGGFAGQTRPGVDIVVRDNGTG